MAGCNDAKGAVERVSTATDGTGMLHRSKAAKSGSGLTRTYGNSHQFDARP